MRMCGVLPIVCRTSLASIARLLVPECVSSSGGDYVLALGAGPRAQAFATMGDALAAAERHLPARLLVAAGAFHARLADAPGRTLSARIPRDASARRQFHGPRHEPRF